MEVLIRSDYNHDLGYPKQLVCTKCHSTLSYEQADEITYNDNPNREIAPGIVDMVYREPVYVNAVDCPVCGQSHKV